MDGRNPDDEQLLEDIAHRAMARPFRAALTARLLLAALAVLAFVALAVALSPSRSTLLGAGVLGAFIFIAIATLILDANRAQVGASPMLATVAAAVQALFFACLIASMLFAYVVQAPILVSSLVVLNLAGLLFWRFRRRYLDAADAAREEER